MNDITFLVTFYAQPEFLKICLDSIRKYYPISSIIVSQEENDEVVDSPENNIVAPYNVRRIQHTMKHGHVWVDVAIGLAKECITDIAVYIEHDAFLLRNIDDMIDKIRSGEYDAIGVEEVVPSRYLNRSSPGMMNQNFFIINMKKMKEIGLEKMRIDLSLPSASAIVNKESGYGISQSLEKKLFLPVMDSGYACGTFYGDVAHHFWYGSFPKRYVENDNINRMWVEEESKRLTKDYWEGKIKND